tara:strand:- start:6124 stop:6579 length:456 start_codon:yes stop_codon:yes gene_type:complete
LLTQKSQILDISEIKSFALNLCKNLKVGDVLMLRGELGVGKTTFSRFIIENLYLLQRLTIPESITSPTYPILITYPLDKYEIHHYDFFRIKNIKEIEELDFFENIKNSITLIEWPDLLINIPFKHNYYLINLDFYSENKRVLDLNFCEHNL